VGEDKLKKKTDIDKLRAASYFLFCILQNEWW